MLNNNLIAGVTEEPSGSIVNPAFKKGTILETWIWPGGTNDFFNFLIQRSVMLVFIIGSLVFFFMLVTGAIQWMSAGGDKQALETAKAKITNALTGVVVLFASFALVTLIENFFGINILTLDISPLIIR
jgi:hypothetical protein